MLRRRRVSAAVSADAFLFGAPDEHLFARLALCLFATWIRLAHHHRHRHRHHHHHDDSHKVAPVFSRRNARAARRACACAHIGRQQYFKLVHFGLSCGLGLQQEPEECC